MKEKEKGRVYWNMSASIPAFLRPACSASAMIFMWPYMEYWSQCYLWVDRDRSSVTTYKDDGYFWWCHNDSRGLKVV